MAAERKKLAVIGALFLFSVVILIGGIMWFKNVRLGGQSQKVRVEFPSTSGLVKGDPVEVHGVPSGQIEDIVFEEGRAVVTLKLDRAVGIYPSAVFTIENVGIMGQKLVALEPGWGGTPLDPSETLFKGTYQPGIPEFMGQLGDVMDSFQRIANRLDRLTESADPEGSSFQRIVKNTDATTADLAAFLKESRGDLTASIKSFRSAMDDLHQTLDGRENDVGRIIDSSVRATERLDSTLISIQRSSDRLNAILGQPEARNGTLAQMVNDPALYQELVTTLRETRSLIADIKENPKKYVKLSLF
jgi:phospholipid/cholesterol/gamma-HCH transport system substrate-binding protein